MPRVVLLLAAFLILAVCRLSLASSCQNGPAQLIEFVGEGKGCSDESTLYEFVNMFYLLGVMKL